MDHFPVAFHITFGTYGTRLHGDERGTVDRRHNQPGDPILGAEPEWERMERRSLKYEPVILTSEQCVLIEQIVPEICARGGWQHHTSAAAPDHVHNVVTAHVDGDVVRRLLKRWLSQELTSRLDLRHHEPWWAECGSVKWVWTMDCYGRLIDYVRGQRMRGCV